MKIALVGFGNMGREVESLINQSGIHEVVSVSFRSATDRLDKSGIAKADVVIDFTSPEIILDTIKEIAGLGKNLVVGTTGWYDHLDEVKEMVKKANTGFIYAQNFSIGANIFFKIVGFASSLFSKFGDYDVAGFEIHHTGKKDSPSGTAKKMAGVIMENFPKKTVLETGRLDRQIRPEELHFASVRAGRHAGYHEAIFDSMADEIRLSHNAHGRRGFAEGAIAAAEFIKDKKGFYSFDEVFKA